MGSTGPKGWTIEKVTCLIGATLKKIDGFGEGAAIKLTPINDLVNYSEGLDGEGVFSYNPGRGHRITITLRRTSKSQNIMGMYYLIGEAFTGEVIFPMVILDANTGSTYEAAHCTISKLPEVTLGRDVEDAEWEIIAADLYRWDVQLT